MSEDLVGSYFPAASLQRRKPQAFVASSGNVVPATSRSPSTVMTFPTLTSRLRHRQPMEHMKRACSLLACGWSFQSWGTEGFAGILGGSCPAAAAVGWLASGGSGTTSQLSITSTRGSCPAAPTKSWRRSPQRRTLSVTHEDGVASATPHRVKVSPTLDVQASGGVVIDENSTIESSNGVEDLSSAGGGNGKRRPKSNNAPRSDRILELLNGLEGGGGFDDDANDFFAVSTSGFEGDAGAVDEYEEITLEERDEDDDNEEDVDDGISDAHREMPAERESGVAPLRPKSARRFRRRIHRRQAPLTRSQTEEEMLYPTVKLIQELALNKDSEDSIEEVLRLMAEVKEEHEEQGLGLAQVYKAGMTACADSGRHRETLRLFDELRAFKDSPPRRQSYDLAIVAHCLLKERDEAVATLREMKVAGYEPTEQTYNFVLRACRGTEGGVEVADQVNKLYAEEEGLSEEDALPLNLELCRSYLLVLATGGEWERALELFWKLATAGGGGGQGYQRWPELDAGCCEAALVACRRAGKWREALQVFRYVRREDVGAELTTAMYMSTVMTMLLDEEEDTDVAVRVAASLYDEMRQLGYFDRLRPSVAASLLNALFAACTRWEDHWPRAVETFETRKELEEETEDETFMPTANQYRSMLHILSQRKEVERGANWERSVEILREAQALDLRLTEVSFNTVIADLGFAEQVDLAFEIHDEMRKAGIPPSTNTYNRLLGVCEKNGQVERAFEVLDEMYKANLPPNVVSFGSAISACGKGYEWRKALALLVRMQHDNVSPNLHCMNAAINALGLSGEWQRAEQIMEVVRQWGLVPNVISYNSLAMAYASAGESERALGALDAMRENNVEPDEITFGTLLMACDSGDAYYSIKSLMDEMDKLGIEKTVIHYCAAIESANRVKETATSWEMWRQMKLSGVEPNNHAYSSVINTAAIDRDVRTALRLLEEMEKKEMAIDVVTYTTAICACGPDWLLALDVLEDMAVDGVQPNLQSYTAVMCCCLAGEEYREAIQMFNRMKEAGITPDLRAYKLAIIAHEKNGDVSGRWAMEAEIANSNIKRYERDWDTRW